MTLSNRNPRIVLAMLCCAWFLCCCAQALAEIEIESFTRYRVDNFDNNNNGYVDGVDNTDIVNEIENTTVAAELSKDMNWEFSTTPTPNVPFNAGNPSNGSVVNGFVSPMLTGFFDTIGNNGWYSGFIDGDGFLGAGGNDNTQYSQVGVPLDFDDLVVLPTALQSMKGNSYLQSRSVQLERVIRFSPKLSEEQKAQREGPSGYWEVYFGARFFQFDDRFRMYGSGGLLGEISVGSQLDNQTAGPHVGIYGSLERGGWTLGAGGMLQAGIYLTDATMNSAIGQDSMPDLNSLVPGRLNTLLIPQQSATHRDDEDSETFFGEVRVQASRPLTKWMRLHFGCSGYLFGDLRYASDSINWELPNMGLADNGTEQQIVTTAYASLEFRR